MKKLPQIRSLYLILGDQLTTNSSFFKDYDSSKDFIWMAEVKEEATHVWTHKARIVMFLSAMRHFKEELESKGMRFSYTEMTSKSPSGWKGCAHCRSSGLHPPPSGGKGISRV